MSLDDQVKGRHGLEPVTAMRLLLPETAGGTRRYATAPISATGEFFPARLLPVSNVRREIDLLGNEYRGNRIEMGLVNTDGAMGQLLATAELYEQAVELLAGVKGLTSLSEFRRMFRGLVYGRTLEGRMLKLTAHDTTPSLPNLPTGVLSIEEFADLPNASKGKTLPLVLGRVE